MTTTAVAAGPAGGRQGGLARQSMLTTVAAAVGLASGLVLDVLIAYRFGAGRATDAFFVGNRLPLALSAVLLVAANQALVPTFSRWLSQDDQRRWSELAGALLTRVLLGGLAVALLLAAAAPALVAVTAPAWTRVPAPPSRCCGCWPSWSRSPPGPRCCGRCSTPATPSSRPR